MAKSQNTTIFDTVIYWCRHKQCTHFHCRTPNRKSEGTDVLGNCFTNSSFDSKTNRWISLYAQLIAKYFFHASWWNEQNVFHCKRVGNMHYFINLHPSTGECSLYFPKVQAEPPASICCNFARSSLYLGRSIAHVD